MGPVPSFAYVLAAPLFLLLWALSNRAIRNGVSHAGATCIFAACAGATVPLLLYPVLSFTTHGKGEGIIIAFVMGLEQWPYFFSISLAAGFLFGLLGPGPKSSRLLMAGVFGLTGIVWVNWVRQNAVFFGETTGRISETSLTRLCTGFSCPKERRTQRAGFTCGPMDEQSCSRKLMELVRTEEECLALQSIYPFWSLKEGRTCLEEKDKNLAPPKPVEKVEESRGNT